MVTYLVVIGEPRFDWRSDKSLTGVVATLSASERVDSARDRGFRDFTGVTTLVVRNALALAVLSFEPRATSTDAFRVVLAEAKVLCTLLSPSGCARVTREALLRAFVDLTAVLFF